MKRYLPLGSVVTLKKADRKIMISGRCQICNEEYFDYSGCLFPQGYLGKDKLYVFNHDDIEEVYYLGFKNEEEVVFSEMLVKVWEENYKERK